MKETARVRTGFFSKKLRDLGSSIYQYIDSDRRPLLKSPTTAVIISNHGPMAFILSWLLPTEATIDIKYMSLSNNICKQPDNGIEKPLARRQLLNKSTDSRSLFINIKKFLLKYDFLLSFNELLTNLIRKSIWKSFVQRAVENLWAEKIRKTATRYPSQEYMNSKLYTGTPETASSHYWHLERS